MLGQADALDVFHDQEVRRPRLVRVVGGHDVRVVQAGGGMDLAAEALGRAGPGQVLRSDHLQGDLPAHHTMFGQPHGAHAARPELAEQPIARVAGQLRRGRRRRQVGRRPQHRCRDNGRRRRVLRDRRPGVGAAQQFDERVGRRPRRAGLAGRAVRQVILDGSTGGAVERAQREGLQLRVGGVNVGSWHRTSPRYDREGRPSGSAWRGRSCQESGYGFSL